MFTRRDFIKTMSLLSGAMLAPVRWLGKWAGVQPAQGEEPPELGELYAGFVLLPEGAEVPEFVKYPNLGPPNPCGIGAGENGLAPNAVTQFFDAPEDLARAVDFPVYTLGKLPEGVRHASAFIEGHQTGEIYCTSLGFDAFNPANNYEQCVISLWSQPDFFRPYPLWFEEPVEKNGPGVALEKVAFLPTPGIKVTTQEGYVCYWIENNVLYTLIVESAWEQKKLATVDALTVVSN